MPASPRGLRRCDAAAHNTAHRNRALPAVAALLLLTLLPGALATSVSPTGSPTSTATGTKTSTPSKTLISPTPTPTSSTTATKTPAQTASVTASPAATGSQTATHTPTETGTGTGTPTHTHTGSATLTRNYVPPSPSITPSGTRTPPNTPSMTGSASITPSPTATATVTPTITPSTSGTSTETGTSTPSPSNTGTPTPSRTSTPSTTGTPTISSTVTSTRTPPVTSTRTPTSTRTASITSTNLPRIVAQMSAAVAVPNVPAASPGSLFVSDAWPAVGLVLSWNMAPDAGESVTVSCVPVPGGGPGDGAALDVVVIPSTGFTFGAASAARSYTFMVLGLFNATSSLQDVMQRGTVVCAAASVGSSSPYFSRSSPTSTPVLMIHARWPFLQDVLMHFAGGLVKSAWSPTTFDARQALSDWCGGDSALCPGNDPDLAITNPGAVAYVVQTVLGGVDPLTASLGAASFSMTLSGETRITLVADTEFWLGNATGGLGVFDGNTTVTLGGVSCNVSWVSGPYLQLLTPPLVDLCNFNLQSDCGFKPLAVSEAFALPPAGVEAAAAAGVLYEPSTTVSCPPLCPGSAAGAVPVAVAPTDAAAAAAAYAGLLPVTVAAALVSPATGVLLLASPPSSGVYFSPVCAGFTDPLQGDCVNASSPLFASCAYGSGDACQLCPRGGMCPGGARLWPLPGYWSPSEASTSVVLCAAPSAARCLGWNLTSGTATCGLGYRAGSYRCLSCDTGYFPAIDGSCDLCPQGSGLASALRILLYFVVALLAFGGINYGALVLVTKFAGGTVAGGAKRSVQLMIWTFTVIQTIVSVGKSASGDLPPLLTSAYTGMDVFQFGGIVPNTACIHNAYPFATDAMQMGLAMSFMALVWLLQVQYRRVCGCRRVPKQPLSRVSGEGEGGDGAGTPTFGTSSRSLEVATTPADELEQRDRARQASQRQLVGGKQPAARGRCCPCPSKETALAALQATKPLLRRFLFTVLTLTYPIVCKSIMDMMYCQDVVISVKSYLAMNNDGSTLTRDGIYIALPPNEEDAAVAALLAETIHVQQLASNPYFVCFEAAHRPMGYLAWVCLFVYAIGYPLSTFLLIRRRIARIVREEYAGVLPAGASDPKRMRLADAVALGTSPWHRRMHTMLSVRWQRGTNVSDVLPQSSGGGGHFSANVGAIASSKGTQQLFIANPMAHAMASSTSSKATVAKPQHSLSSVLQHASPPADSPHSPALIEPLAAASGGDVGEAGGATAPAQLPSRGPMSMLRSLRQKRLAAKNAAGSHSALVMGHRASSTTNPLSAAAATAGGSKAGGVIGGGGQGPSALFGSTRSLLSTASSGASSTGERDIASMTVTEFVDTSPELLYSQAYAHFTAADFRPSKYYFRQLDMGALFVLSCLLVFWANPADLPSIIMKMVVTLATVLGLAGIFALVQPFPNEFRWKHWVKIFSLVLCAIAAVLNCCISIAGRMGDSAPAPLNNAIQGMALLVFILSILLFVCLIFGFWLTLMESAKEEQDDIVRLEMAEAEAVAMTQGSLGRRLFPALMRSLRLRSLRRHGRGGGGASASALSGGSAEEGGPTPHPAAALDAASSGRMRWRVGGSGGRTPPSAISMRHLGGVLRVMAGRGAPQLPAPGPGALSMEAGGAGGSGGGHGAPGFATGLVSEGGASEGGAAVIPSTAGGEQPTYFVGGAGHQPDGGTDTGAALPESSRSSLSIAVAPAAQVLPATFSVPEVDGAAGRHYWVPTSEEGALT